MAFIWYAYFVQDYRAPAELCPALQHTVNKHYKLQNIEMSLFEISSKREILNTMEGHGHIGMQPEQGHSPVS